MQFPDDPNIEEQLDEAEAAIHRLDESLEEDDSAEGCDASVEELLPYIQANPLFAYGWLRLAMTAMAGTEDGPLDSEEIVQALDRAVFLSDTWPEAHIAYGDAMLDIEGDASAAAAAYQSAVELAREQLESAYAALIDALNGIGDDESLRRIVDESKRIFPESDAIREAIGDWDSE